MAKRAKSRSVARKVRDKWRTKQWYNIIAPDLFERRPIGATLADDSSKVVGRSYEVTLQEVTGNFARGFVKLQFRITHTDGLDAHTTFVGHELTSDQVRRRTRRRRTKIDTVVDVQTKDGARVRLKPILVADSRIQTSQKLIIRKKVNGLLTNHSANITFSDLIGAMMAGDLNRTIQEGIRKIYPIGRRSIEIAKSHVLEHARTKPAVEDSEADYDSIPEKETGTEEKEGEKEEVDYDSLPDEPGEGKKDGAAEGAEEPAEEGETPVAEAEASESVQDAEIPEEIPAGAEAAAGESDSVPDAEIPEEIPAEAEAAAGESDSVQDAEVPEEVPAEAPEEDAAAADEVESSMEAEFREEETPDEEEAPEEDEKPGDVDSEESDDDEKEKDDDDDEKDD